MVDGDGRLEAPPASQSVEDMYAGKPHNVEYSIRIINVHTFEALGGSCGDCNHKWLKEAAKIAVSVQYEVFKALQWLCDLQSLVFSRWRK